MLFFVTDNQVLFDSHDRINSYNREDENTSKCKFSIGLNLSRQKSCNQISTYALYKNKP